MDPRTGLTHFDEEGQAIMVDVSGKQETSRTAIATGRIKVNQAVYDAIEQGTAKKGDVLGVARVAGIMAATHCQMQRRFHDAAHGMRR